MKLKIFDVVELNDKNRATILNINNKEYLAEVVNSAGISLGNKVIKDNDINKIIVSKKNTRYLLVLGKYLFYFFAKNMIK